MTNLSPEQLKSLRELAESADTGGPWREGTKNVWCENTNECVAVTYRNRLSKEKQLDLAAFIAAFDPSTCLQLVAMAEECVRLRANTQARRDRYANVCGQEAATIRMVCDRILGGTE